MQSLLRTFQSAGPNATLREIAIGLHTFTPVGTADAVAGQMQEAMEEIGGDGFLVAGPYQAEIRPLDHRRACPGTAEARAYPNRICLPNLAGKPARLLSTGGGPMVGAAGFEPTTLSPPD